jgi:hypothetical protein
MGRADMCQPAQPVHGLCEPSFAQRNQRSRRVGLSPGGGSRPFYLALTI